LDQAGTGGHFGAVGEPACSGCRHGRDQPSLRNCPPLIGVSVLPRQPLARSGANPAETKISSHRAIPIQLSRDIDTSKLGVDGEAAATSWSMLRAPFWRPSSCVQIFFEPAGGPAFKHPFCVRYSRMPGWALPPWAVSPNFYPISDTNRKVLERRQLFLQKRNCFAVFRACLTVKQEDIVRMNFDIWSCLKSWVILASGTHRIVRRDSRLARLGRRMGEVGHRNDGEGSEQDLTETTQRQKLIRER